MSCKSIIMWLPIALLYKCPEVLMQLFTLDEKSIAPYLGTAVHFVHQHTSLSKTLDKPCPKHHPLYLCADSCTCLWWRASFHLSTASMSTVECARPQPYSSGFARPHPLPNTTHCHPSLCQPEPDLLHDQTDERTIRGVLHCPVFVPS